MQTRDEPITIRDARITDAAAIAEIYRPIVENTAISFEHAAPDEGEMARRIQAVIDNNYPYLVAEGSGADGALLGYAYASRFRARPAYDGTAETSVYVGENAARGGVGRALMTELERRLRAGGFTLMVAGMSGEEADVSIAFHTALGFELTGFIPAAGVKFGREHRLAFMWKRL